MPNNSINSTTQQYLDIYDVTNDTVIMKNGSAAVILSVSALNFGLLAEEEQDAIIYSYAGLLNSINYPIQILVKSQTKDVTNYLQLLKQQEEESEDKMKSMRISRYKDFVANLIQERNVLDKKFYVIIPASPIEMGILSAQSVVPGVESPDVSTIEKSVLIERAKNNLEPKRDHLVAQFGRIGLYSRQLKTQEIIQLFYIAYNPEAAEGQQLTESKNYTTPLVKASVQGNIIMTDQPTPATTMAPQTEPVAPAPMTPPTTSSTIDSTKPEAPTATPAPIEQTVPGLAPAPVAPSPDEVIAAASAPVSIEPMTTPEMLAPMAPAPVSPTEPIPVVDLQNEINSTIEKLGEKPGLTPNPTASSVPPTQPTPIKVEATPSPTPAPMPEQTSNAPATPQAPAELPEI